MELVELMYHYINKFINSDELLEQIENIDLSKYSEEETKEIDNLKSEIVDIREKYENEDGTEEQERQKELDSMIKSISEYIEAIKNNPDESFNTDGLLTQYDNLLKEKERKIDNGERYNKLFDLLTQNDLINKYAAEMSDEELLKFITNYIAVPLPLKLTQEDFDDLIKIGIEKDDKEALWRMACNYAGSDMDFSLIEEDFILKKDYYFLAELISVAVDDLNSEKLTEKIIKSGDKNFIKQVAEYCNDLELLDESDRLKLKNASE